MINGIKPTYIKETNYGIAMDSFLTKVTNNTIEYFNERYDNLPKPEYVINKGRRFDKVIRVDSSKSVYCFIEKETGNIYKAAGWRAPYLNGNNPIRGNIYDTHSYQNADPHGSWLYI